MLYLRRCRSKAVVYVTKAAVRYGHGEEEMECVKKAARPFQSCMPSAILYV